MIQAPLPDEGRDAASMYESYTAELAKTCELLLRKHGNSMAGRQRDLQRVADVLTIDKGCYPRDVVS